MSKVKDNLLLTEEKEYELYIGYEEWLLEHRQELTELDINKMEESLFKTSSIYKPIITPTNNKNYINKGTNYEK